MRAGEDQQVVEPDDGYPLWRPTDWTREQRFVAILGLMLLALACGLFLGALLVWGMTSLALATVIPLGVIFLCLGTTLVTATYCYAYIHCHNNTGYSVMRGERGYGSRLGLIGATSALLIVELGLALLSLLVQTIAIVQVVMMGWEPWQSTSQLSAIGAPFIIYTMLLLACLLFSFVTPPGFQSIAFTWRPTRDPAMPDSILTTPVTGVRFGVRWLIMAIPYVNWLLIGGPLVILLEVGERLPVAGASVVLGVLVCFFLLAALSELTHRA